MQIPFLAAWGLAVGVIAAVAVVTKYLQRDELLRIERNTGMPRGNELGAAVARNECPACGDTDASWFHGPASARYSTLYCGNKACKAGWKVENFGGGCVFAEPGEPGPDHLYR
jgi:hypothetical protein